jgi:hypothetical protein
MVRSAKINLPAAPPPSAAGIVFFPRKAASRFLVLWPAARFDL